jgi:hypothetical protein
MRHRAVFGLLDKIATKTHYQRTTVHEQGVTASEMIVFTAQFAKVFSPFHLIPPPYLPLPPANRADTFPAGKCTLCFHRVACLDEN